ADLPPAAIFTAQYDILRGDGEAYAARLQAAGVTVRLRRFAGLTHEAASYTRSLITARRWQAEAAQAIKTHLSY
ncbi:MAG: alpha/beta hydrolase, partial [Bifidobacteriaceae bacterium]|nr:alpha/beta hydrolase [Bifidobacteriaceae bacterium]